MGGSVSEGYFLLPISIVSCKRIRQPHFANRVQTPTVPSRSRWGLKKSEKSAFIEPISDPFFNLILNATTFHPPYGQKVDKGAHHAVANIIFGFPVPPRMMGNRDFDDTKSFHLHQCRQKPMHAIKDRNRTKALFLKHAKGTRAVVNGFAAQRVSNAIADL